MTINNYVNNYTAINEQNLAEDLVIESIQFSGMDMKYLPRTDVDVDYLYSEDLSQAFNESYIIEMYLINVEGFGGGDLFSGFGLEINDTATFTVSKRRFTEETDAVRPKEGDLLYMPMTESLLEIKYVEPESPFYQHGKTYVWELKCELYQYNNEEISTGDFDIDQLSAELNDLELDDPVAINDEVEAEADELLVFDPLNPFGER